MKLFADNGRFVCQCVPPVQHPAPIRRDTCVKCSGYLSPKWRSNDVVMEKLWQRLEDGMFPNAGENPEWFEQFKHLAVTRERAGRDEFGFAYLSPNRDNIAEAAEELGDFIVYVFLDSLRARRENGGDDEDIDVVLTAASLAAQAFEHLSRLKHKRRGAP